MSAGKSTTSARTLWAHSWPRTRVLSQLAGVGALAALYFITARFGLLMDAVGGIATTVWPPSGISLVALTLFGYRLWPGVALGALLANATSGVPLLVACGIATGNTLEALVGTCLVRQLVGARGRLDHVQGAVAFIIFVAGFSTTLSASIGVISGRLGGVIQSGSVGQAWLSWWLGDAMGELILAPLLFVWSERPRLEITPLRIAEAGALVVSLIMVGLLVFGTYLPSPLAIFLQPYVLLPFLVWTALRFGLHGTVAATLLVSVMAIWRTMAGLGPFSRGGVNESLLLLQAFMAIVAVTMLVLSAGITEWKRAQARVRVNYSVARVLADATTLESANYAILGGICESLRWDSGNVWIVDPDTETLRLVAEWHRPGVQLEAFSRTAVHTQFRSGVGMAGRVWSEARPMWVPNLAADTHLVRGSLAVEAGLRSAMGFPIWIGSEVHGVMTFFSREPSEPDETLLQMMTTIGSQIGAFIQRQKAEADLRATHADLEATVARRTGQLAKMNSALRAEVAERRLAEDSLQRLSTRLLRIQDEERQRLARELHDSTAQSLAALAMSLAVVRERRDALDDRARKALDESDLLADLCSREIRSMSYLLHPPFLQEVGLPAALRWCAEGFSRRSGIDVAVDVPDDFGRLAPDVETALYRVAQECLANVQRHSGSTQAWIQLARTDRGTTLQVRDHGRGMPAGILQRPDAVESLGVGLLGMRERVRQLGGHLRIVTGEQGTVIEVEIDLPQGEA